MFESTFPAPQAQRTAPATCFAFLGSRLASGHYMELVRKFPDRGGFRRPSRAAALWDRYLCEAGDPEAIDVAVALAYANLGLPLVSGYAAAALEIWEDHAERFSVTPHIRRAVVDSLAALEEGIPPAGSSASVVIGLDRAWLAGDERGAALDAMFEQSQASDRQRRSIDILSTVRRIGRLDRVIPGDCPLSDLELPARAGIRKSTRMLEGELSRVIHYHEF